MTLSDDELIRRHGGTAPTVEEVAAVDPGRYTDGPEVLVLYVDAGVGGVRRRRMVRATSARPDPQHPKRLLVTDLDLGGQERVVPTATLWSPGDLQVASALLARGRQAATEVADAG